MILLFKNGFPDSSVGKESTCNVGDPSLIPGSGRSTGEGIGYPLHYSRVSLVAQLVTNPLQCGRPGFDLWVGRIPWRRKRLPTPVSWPREFHGLYSLWSCNEWLWASLVAQTVKNLTIIWEIRVQSLGWEDLLEKGMAAHSSVLAWRMSWTEESGGLQSTGSQRFGHDWATNTHTI